MFKELEKYTETGTFFLEAGQDLNVECNAPTDKSGVYLVYSVGKEREELIYIGCSGNLNEDGSIFIRKAGLGGMKDRIVNGHQFGKKARKHTWPVQMDMQHITQLKVRWFVTHGNKYADCPHELESRLLQYYKREHNGILPAWNKKL